MEGGEVTILICTEPTGDDLVSNLPSASTNIFQRIIRNPRPESANARERECTEMLASVLMNAPTLRRCIFRWMADMSDLDAEVIKQIDDLDFDYITEGFIGRKRDDLRIEGRRVDDADENPFLLWTVEVKVGSAFHRSAAQTLDDDCEPIDYVEDDGIDEKLVNQLKHYDDWLDVRHAQHCGGFVLALNDLGHLLPALGLKRTWTCVSWTRLGLEIRSAIKGQNLPPQETLLAKHLFGFISKNLWRLDEMPATELRLDFNDIALIRAFSKIGRDCERKVNELVAAAIPVITEAGVGIGEVTASQRLFKGSSSSYVERFLVPGQTKGSDPCLHVGIGSEGSYEEYLGVWVLMSPNHSKAKAVLKSVEPFLKKLHERQLKWEMGTGVEDDYAVLGLTVPLTDLLAAENQQAKLKEFVKAALTDLKITGAVDAIVSSVGGSRRKVSKG